MTNKNKLGFTLVELIVSITVLAILATVAFISFSGYTKQARDTARVSDVTTIKKALNLFETRESYYPETTNGTSVTYLDGEVRTQGVFGSGTRQILESVASEVVDPLTGVDYIYSVLNTDKEYQLGAILEGADLGAYNGLLNQTHAANTAYAYIVGDYNGYTAKVSTGGTDYVLAVPTIISGDMSLTDVIDQINAGKLLYNGYLNIPGSYDGIFDTSPENLIVTSTGEENIVVFSGSFESLEINEQVRTAFIKRLQDSYSGTTVEGNDKLKKVTDLNIDVSNPSVEVREAAINIIEFGLNAEIAENQKPLPAGCSLDGVNLNHGEDITAFSEETIIWSSSHDCSDRDLVRTCTEGVLSGDNSFQYATCVKGTPNNCGATVQDGYNIGASNHSVVTPITKVISHPTEANGTRTYNANALCFDGSYQISGETNSLVCNSGYHIEIDSCVSDARPFSDGQGSGTETWVNGSGWGITFSYSSCNTGYTLNGSSCIQNTWEIGSWGSCSANPSWGLWSTCSESCGGGIQTRTCDNTSGTESRSVVCKDYNNTTLGDSNCIQSKPTTSQGCSESCSGSSSQSCNTQSCYTYSWYTGSRGSCSANPSWGPWSSCSESCGGGWQYRSCDNTSGTQSRTVYCRRSDGASVSDSYCGGGKPSSTQSCSESCSGSSSQQCNTHTCCVANMGASCCKAWQDEYQYSISGGTCSLVYSGEKVWCGNGVNCCYNSSTCGCSGGTSVVVSPTGASRCGTYGTVQCNGTCQ